VNYGAHGTDVESRAGKRSQAGASQEHSGWTLILLTYAHGMRASETAALQLSDVDIAASRVTINRAKGSRKTVQTLSPNSNRLLNERRALSEWLAMRPTQLGPALFPSRKGGTLSRIQVYRLIRSYAELAGLSKAKRGAHSLKHSLGQHMVDARQDITRVQAALGHSSITSTAHYFRVSDAQADEARQATLMARM
jgi:type 1 fimbriae regulatory protein FimB